MVDQDLLPKTPKYLKVPLIILNSILWILGLVLIIVGGIAVSFFSNFKDFTKDSSSYKDVFNQITTSGPTGVLVIGIFFVVLTIVGCVVAVRERVAGLIVYTLIMLMLLIALIGIGGKSLSLQDKDYLDGARSTWMEVANGPKNSTITKLESFLECCQFDRNDINGTALCPKDNIGIIKYQSTCDEIIKSKISSLNLLLGSAACTIGVIEFISMLFALFLIIRICRSPNSKSYTQY